MSDPSPPESTTPGKKPLESGKANAHLANARTFLAWVRTCIAIISLGFVVARFGVWLQEMTHAPAGGGTPAAPVHEHSSGIGAGMVVAGALLAPLAAWHHYRVGRDIEAGNMAPSYRLAVLLSALVVLLSAVLVGYLLLSTDGR